jgi:hypothetical protein
MRTKPYSRYSRSAQRNARVKRCASHQDPAQWRERPDPLRPGWVNCYCRTCGEFVGALPEQLARSQPAARAAQALTARRVR